MQTQTFTQKLLRQRSFLGTLIPLLAVFFGLGSVTKASAQAATFSGQQIIVNQGNGNVTYSATTFNGSYVLVNQTPPGTVTSFDINGTLPVLNGGNVTVTGVGTTTGITSANLTYEVRDNGFALITSGSIPMTTASPAGNNRTFTLSGTNINLLSGITTAGTYYVGVSYSSGYQKTGVPPGGTISDPNGPYYAQFNVTGIKTPPPTINASAQPANIVLAADGSTTGNTYYFPNNPGSTPQFPGANITSATNANSTTGAFDVNNGQLRLQNTTVTTTEAGSSTISSVVLYYRTRLQGTAGGAYQPINLTQQSVNSGVRTFILDPALGGNNPQPNLIATPAVTTAGTYVVDIYYQANGVTNGTPFTLFYPPTAPATPYSATFVVSGTPFATTIWTGAVNDNWFDAGNWTNGVPNENVNAQVRDIGAGNSVPYPNIYSNTIRTTAGGAVLYNNSTSGPAKTRNLIMGGTSQANRSITRLQVGQLQVFGNFDNTYDSFIQRENTIMEFAGVNQNITGGSFFRVDISGGGTKNLAGVMTIQTSLNFLTGVTTGSEPAVTNPFTAPSANAGILYTNIATPNISVVVLTDRTPFNNNNGSQLTGETDASFLYGFVRTSRANVLINEARTYGNMGLEIEFGGTINPGNVDVTRNTVEAYSPVSGSGKFGIRRIFGVRPSDPSASTGGLVATLRFRYRDSETVNLDGPNTITPGTGSIPESRLALFLSQNSGNTFSYLGRDGAVDVTNNIVVKSGVRFFATFTLGDTNNPLPVRLTAFDAKRLGNDALVTWQTASEMNSKGYEVQVSTNGTEFRTLTMVPSASPNSVAKQSYKYEDTESNKVGIRYYRLHQLDLDGKDAYFGPIAVSFEGKASAATAMVAYPNPFNSNDELHVTLQSAVAGTGKLLMTDMTGRTISQQSVALNLGLSDLTVAGLTDLQSGLYMVKLTLPSGEVKNLKVVKQ